MRLTLFFKLALADFIFYSLHVLDYMNVDSPLKTDLFYEGIYTGQPGLDPEPSSRVFDSLLTQPVSLPGE